MEWSTIFSKNIINLTGCTIIKMPGANTKILGASQPTKPNINQPKTIPSDNF
jgi:hypothetical protein